MTIFERDETGTADSCDWLDTGGASLGEQLSEALGTVRLLVAAGEALPGQGHLTVGAGETLAVPRFVLVGHTAAGDDLLALDATGCVLFFVASGAVDLLLTGDKGFGTDGGFADAAAEALLVPLSGLVFHLFGSWCCVPTVSQPALDPQMTPEGSIFFGCGRPRQEHTQHSNVLVVVFGPLDPICSNGFGFEPQPVKIRRQNIGRHSELSNLPGHRVTK